MNILLFVNDTSNTYAKESMITSVIHWSHAVLPVPWWYEANAKNERKRMRVIVTLWRSLSSILFYSIRRGDGGCYAVVCLVWLESTAYQVEWDDGRCEERGVFFWSFLWPVVSSRLIAKFVCMSIRRETFEHWDGFIIVGLYFFFLFSDMKFQEFVFRIFGKVSLTCSRIDVESIQWHDCKVTQLQWRMAAQHWRTFQWTPISMNSSLSTKPAIFTSSNQYK